MCTVGKLKVVRENVSQGEGTEPWCSPSLEKLHSIGIASLNIMVEEDACFTCFVGNYQHLFSLVFKIYFEIGS